MRREAWDGTANGHSPAPAPEAAAFARVGLIRPCFIRPRLLPLSQGSDRSYMDRLQFQQWAPSPFVFMIFSLFYRFSSVSIASHSIFGNAYWKHWPTSSPTVATIPYFFLWKFPCFIAIFHLQKHTFLYMKVHTGPWKQCPLLSPTVSTIADVTNAPYSPAWMIATGAKK